MLKIQGVFSSFSVKDLDAAEEFYSKKLGLSCQREGEMGLLLELTSGATVFIYQKSDHRPATYTVLNLEVANIDAAVQQLTQSKVELERYNIPEMPQDEKGIFRGDGTQDCPVMAWFTDPSGNILAVVEAQASKQQKAA